MIEIQVPSALSLDALRSRVRGAQLEIALAAAITLLAAVVRLIQLEGIPPGLHGDEAWTGIDARRIMDEGWIGPYVTSALGQPTGPMYFTAFIFSLFGETLFTLRLSMALLGIATVPLAYLTFRTMFDRPTGMFAAFLLAVGLWHLHYSRISFMVIAWPLAELAALLFLFLGARSGRWPYFALSGLAFGLGVYTYNAYPVFVAPFGLSVVWLGVWQRRDDLARYAAQVAVLALVAFIAALPLVLYVLDDDNDYFGHHRTISLLETEEWEEAGLIERGDILFDEWRDFLGAAFWDGQPDAADGAGHQAMVDRLSLLLIVAGIGVLLWRWRRPASVAVLLLALLLPAGTVVTTQGTFRQTFGMTPFLAVLAAVPLGLWWSRSEALPASWRNVSYACIAVVLAAIAYLNLSFYFGEFPDTDLARNTFVGELTDASQFVEDFPGDPYVYFYSARWSYDYETRRYLAPDVPGEDRSREFGTYSLTIDPMRDALFVFLDPYLESEPEQVARAYPGGEAFVSEEDGRTNFRAYFVPAGTEPRPGELAEPTPTPPQPGGDERDAQRARDLDAIRTALEEYRQARGSYPETGGGIQTLCAFETLDAGCDLRDTLDPVPGDPLGDPGANGYWYVSEGDFYTVWAQRETEAFPACEEHPEHLAGFPSVMCVRAP